jgi:hypothetical protein
MVKSATESIVNAEEAFVWACARAWRNPAELQVPDDMDWHRVVATARANRMQVLLHRVLRANDLIERLPPSACEALQQDVVKLAQDAELLGRMLADYLRRAAERMLETVVLKGLAVAVDVYGDPAVRPGGDIDLLVRQRDVEASLDILDEMGLGQHWPNLLDDRFYKRHHLHLQRCSEDLRVWFEIHWALDHPYTLLTIDYDAMLNRAKSATLLGQPVKRLAPADLLLSLAVHLVKHAVYLPTAIDRSDVARLILADGMLMYFVDVAQAIGCYAGQLDWSLLVARTQESGASTSVGSVLRICRTHLDARVPEWVFEALPVQEPSRLRRWALDNVAAYELATYLGQEPRRLWDLLLVTNGAFILRPIRVLDTLSYFNPDAEYLQRRYGDNSPRTAAAHRVRAAREYARLGIDTLYYAWERHRRLRALDHSTSLFNRLDVAI